MLIKMIENGNIVWGDAGDIESRVTFANDEDAHGPFVVGRATFDDGSSMPVKAYLNDRDEKYARARVTNAFMVNNAFIRPRPSAEAIAKHEAECRELRKSALADGRTRVSEAR